MLPRVNIVNSVVCGNQFLHPVQLRNNQLDIVVLQQEKEKTDTERNVYSSSKLSEDIDKIVFPRKLPNFPPVCNSDGSKQLIFSYRSLNKRHYTSKSVNQMPKIWSVRNKAKLAVVCMQPRA